MVNKRIYYCTCGHRANDHWRDRRENGKWAGQFKCKECSCESYQEDSSERV